MPRCRNVLVPVDLADFSPRIVPYVLKVAEKFETTVHLLFVETDHLALHTEDSKAIEKVLAPLVNGAKTFPLPVQYLCDSPIDITSIDVKEVVLHTCNITGTASCAYRNEHPHN